MRARGIPLYGLESGRPLREFDLVGVTLQSELTFTNIFTVLDLGGIPLLAAERGEDDPLVCAGGPCAINPTVLAPFFDFFVLGDGEEALGEILRLLRDHRGEPREARLAALSAVEGVYLPGESIPARPVSVLRVRDLDRHPIPGGLPVPVTEVVQHHLPVEIMRGCTTGCRFCQAGMHYRPVRVRSVERIVETVLRGVQDGGWDSVTLLSLSSADYPRIGELVDRLLPELEPRGITLSFPSLRVDRSTLALLERVEGARKGGLTFAVEAGSRRLREVIGKKVEEEDLLRLAREAFERGWTMVKLYFMLGLPTERDEDVDEIARLVNELAAVARAVKGRRNLNLSVGAFVPKPGTPFQWEAQDLPERIREKVARLRGQLRGRNINLKFQEPELSAFEGILARGDGRLAPVLLEGWRRGARFDGWSEHFDWGRWVGLLREHGLEPAELIGARDPQAPLPWDFVRMPVRREYLLAQRDKALRGENVPDCRQGSCLGCGAEEASFCDWSRSAEAAGRVEPAAAVEASRPQRPPLVTEAAGRMSWRLRYAKLGPLRFCGHLDLIRDLEFCLRRSGLPLVYSGGFNPRMRLHFSPPLPLGVESRAEYLDLETLALSDAELRQGLERAFAGFPGFELLEARALPAGAEYPHLSRDIALYRYRAELADGPRGEDWERLLAQQAAERLAAGGRIERLDSKGRPKAIDLSAPLSSVAPGGAPGALRFELPASGPDTLRPEIFLAALFGLEERQALLCRVCKEEALVFRGGRTLTPLEH